MIRLKHTSFILFFVLLFLCSCSGLSRVRHETRYYTLEYPLPRSSHPKPLPLVIKMEPFSVSPVYKTSRIIYQDQAFNLKTYTYHHWRANPVDLVQHFLLRDLRSSGLCRAVLPYTSRSAASYVLEGSLDQFMERDRDKGWEAVLTLSITLINRGEKDDRRRIVMQKDYHAVEPCQGKTPLAVVEAMSRAMARTSGQIILDLYEALKGQ